MINRPLQRHVDVLEFIGCVAPTGGEAQATLASYLFDTRPCQTFAPRCDAVEKGDVAKRKGDDDA
ncbi:hypothetical protein CO662_34475 [Rhizobium anhuiense]|uniref:Uncharacterized protein n=1 Tax=Rhizobium anhuiense TaxID=1184720 RepID=A0ABX4J053_9HYPH|nr:hypothetical protein CO668_33290 [Rhizobium anhuiense]PDS47523.1 hypothetical protein CO662_34475 [Rhizobium anhuiense]